MRNFHRIALFAAPFVASALACSSSRPATSIDDAGSAADAALDAASNAADGGADADAATGGARSKIEHMVVVVQENHTFDSYFGRYCTAPAGSNPPCTTGPSCCEAAPDKDPSGASPQTLDDTTNAAFDPDHTTACETAEINGGKMDGFVKGPSCANARNFAYADPGLVKTYTDLAAGGALADRYFQPVIGQSFSNDMYLARAGFVFSDNEYVPQTYGASCESGSPPQKAFTDTTIGDLLVQKGVSFAWYGEGYKDMVAAGGACPNAPPDCPMHVPTYPCLYDPGDFPFQYFTAFADNPTYIRDFSQLAQDIAAGALPAVVFVRAIGYRSEHPGYGDKISAGATFVKGVADTIAASPYGASTLVIVTFDEGGGYFDHVPPPPASPVDGKPYGTRVPFVATGPFVKKNAISHVVMEHSSIVKFIEWNWLGATGQLGTRDTAVNNIGSLLDPAATGTAVPEN